MSKKLGLYFRPFILDTKYLKRIFVNGKNLRDLDLKKIRDREKFDVDNDNWKSYCCIYKDQINKMVRVVENVDSRGFVKVRLCTDNSQDFILE